MAWEYPKHICGHDGERVQMYGKTSERARKLEWIESDKCPNCRKAEQAKKNEEKSLVELIGTEKQILWANEIRARILSYIDDLDKCDFQLPEELSEDDRGVCQEIWGIFCNLLKSKTNASWWIEKKLLFLRSTVGGKEKFAAIWQFSFANKDILEANNAESFSDALKILKTQTDLKIQ